MRACTAPFAAAGAIVAVGALSLVGSLLGASVQASASSRTVVLLGDGVAGAHFGQTEDAAISGLSQAFGPPKSSAPVNEKGNCNIDAAMHWAELSAYFDHGRFVGFSTLTLTGEQVAEPSVVTAKGLRVGDTLAEARHLYGAALRTSYAQGGSWSATTPDGTLDGYLSAEVDQKSPPPRVESIEAGAVGCPAASP